MDLWTVAKPVITSSVALTAAAGAWKYFFVDPRSDTKERIRKLEDEKQATIDRYEKVVASLRAEAEQRETRCIEEKRELEQRCDRLSERWRREVEFGAERYLHARDEEPGEDPPSVEELLPEWEENTSRHERAEIVRGVVDHYRDSTPPRGKHPADAVVIDDNLPMLGALRRVLESILPRWRIVGFSEPGAGRNALVAAPHVKLAVVDYHFAESRLDGEAIIDQALKVRPNLRGRIIVCSGVDISPATARRLFDELGCLNLPKPVQRADLERMVYKALGRTPAPFKAPRQ